MTIAEILDQLTRYKKMQEINRNEDVVCILRYEDVEILLNYIKELKGE